MIRFWLNGHPVEVEGLSPTTTLLNYLRDHRQETGTKEGCAEGDCGACTVALLDPDGPEGATYRGVNACLLLLPMVNGRHVVTVEGLADASGPHPVQRALTDALGSQCGYCTPGVVMSMFEACYRPDLDAGWKLDDQMCGNLCRCTGYRPIRDATEDIAGLMPTDRFTALRDAAPPRPGPLTVETETQRFFAPTNLTSLFELLEAHPEHRFVAGATDLGLDVTQRHIRFPCLVSVEHLSELHGMHEIPGGLSLGAAVPLSDVEALTATRHLPMARMLRYFGARQIKHRATLGGNVCNASPIGDTPPVLLAMDATMIALSRDGERRIPAEDFFTGYRQTALAAGEVLARIELPDVPTGARAASYKVSKRRELDISAVAATYVVEVDEAGIVTRARLAYGGMAATPKRAHHAEAALVGSPWTLATVEAAAALLAQDFQPMSDHRGSAWYRATLAKNLLIGFFIETEEVRTPTLPEGHSATVIA
ncbi:MAG: xanthine dehydrogenase small subunit [Myxococcota bacterium]